jgi:hypothetical protein
MVSCAEKSRLWAGFSRLSEENRSEILGMAEAFTYAQRLTGSEPAAGEDGSIETMRRREPNSELHDSVIPRRKK